MPLHQLASAANKKFTSKSLEELVLSRLYRYGSSGSPTFLIYLVLSQNSLNKLNLFPTDGS